MREKWEVERIVGRAWLQPCRKRQTKIQAPPPTRPYQKHFVRSILPLGGAEHFWQKRYYDFNLRNERQFVEKLRYIHRNPVTRGLCERPEDWEWSSFRHYASGEEARVEIESEWTTRKRERAAGKLWAAVELPHSSQRTA